MRRFENRGAAFGVFTSLLGLMLLGLALARSGTDFWRIAMAATGVTLLVQAVVLTLIRWNAARQIRHDLQIFAALHDLADCSTVLVDSATLQVLWCNRWAKHNLDVSGGNPAALLLSDISADPDGLAMRLHETADARGIAIHEIALVGSVWRLSVRPAGHQRMLWQISERGLNDLRDELPFDLVQTDGSGKITYMSPGFRSDKKVAVRRLSDLFELPLPAIGNMVHVVTRCDDVRRMALRLPVQDGSDTFILFRQTMDMPGLADDFSALQVLPVAIGLLDKDGYLSRYNNETARLLRLGQGEAPRFCELLEGLGRPVGEWLADIRAGRVSHATEVLRAVHPADDLFLQVSLRPYGSDGGLLAIMHDATELKALEAKFTQSQKMQAIGQLAGGVAHDFNNLLTAISGHCDLILLRHDRSDLDYPDLMQIQQNTNRAAGLVRQLLAFSRQQTLQFEMLDLHDLLADATHLLNRLVGERVTLTLRHGVGVPLIRSDKRQFEQILMNLVVNARDAMPMGGEIVIETEFCVLESPLKRDRATVPPGDYAVIKVRDEGTGMPSAIIAKVFDPFFSTKRQGEGTGLGLSTAYGIVKQSGGFIFVDSEEGQGTVFSIYFSAQTNSEAVPVKPAAVKAVPEPAQRSTVLLVEDEAPVRSFAARALQLQGHDVIEAETGEAALAILSDPLVRPDVFVTDVIMPGLDGPAWVEEIRDRFPDTPVVFMSGYAEDSRVAAQSRLGDVVFIGKPFSLAEFTQIVNDQLRRVSEAA